MRNEQTSAVDPAALADGFDLRALPDDFYDDPFRYYDALRATEPVKRLPDGGYFLTRYADCPAVYKDAATFSSDKKVEFKPKYGDSPLYEHHTTSLVFSDPPLHTRVRRLIAGALTPRAIAAMEPDLVALVEGLLDRMAGRDTVDLIEDFAAAIPIEVIGNLLGVPHRERDPLRGWSLAILGALEPVISTQQFEAIKVRVVCKSCNNGWMGSLESEAKPTLKRILDGDSFEVTHTQQASLARWVTTKVVVSEHAARDRWVTPALDRMSLAQDGIVPDSFAIFIGTHKTKADSGWVRISQILAASEQGPDPALKEEPHNVQTVAWICGPLFVFVFCIREKAIDAATFFNTPDMIQLYPHIEGKIQWPPIQHVHRRTMSLLAYALDDMKNLPNVRYVGDLR